MFLAGLAGGGAGHDDRGEQPDHGGGAGDGPPGSPGPSGATGPTGPPGTDGVVVLAAVFAPGTVSAKAGKKLKVKYGVTNAASVKFTLKGKKTVTKQVSAKAGVNTLKWKLPKSLKAGKYTLRLSFQGTVKAKTKVKVKK